MSIEISASDNKNLESPSFKMVCRLVTPEIFFAYAKKNESETLEIAQGEIKFYIDFTKSTPELIAKKISHWFQLEKEVAKPVAEYLFDACMKKRSSSDAHRIVLDGRGGASEGIVWLPTGEGRYAVQRESECFLVSIEHLKDGSIYCGFENYEISRPVERTGELLKLPTSWWDEWAAGKHAAQEGAKLFQQVLRAIQLFHDVPRPADEIMQTLQILLSYARLQVSNFSRYRLTAKRGSGKTVQLETIAALSLGGRLVSNISAASYAREQSSEYCAWAIDELDSLVSSKHGETEDHPLVQGARQGYRPNATYTRYNSDLGRSETVEISSPLQYSAINELDSQLQSRGTSTEVAQSRDKRLPLLHSQRVKPRWLLGLKAQLVAWFLANAKGSQKSSDSFNLEMLPEDNDSARQTIADSAIEGFQVFEKEFIIRFSGRTEELALSLVEVGRVFGLSQADYEAVTEMLDVVQVELSQPAEGLALDLFEILCKKFESPLVVEIPQADVFKALMEKTTIHVGNKRQRGLLREAGIPADAVVKVGSEPRKIVRTPALLEALGIAKDDKDDKDNNDVNTRTPSVENNLKIEKMQAGGVLGISDISSLSSLSDKMRAREVDGLLSEAVLDELRHEHASELNKIICVTGELREVKSGLWKFEPKGNVNNASQPSQPSQKDDSVLENVNNASQASHPSQNEEET